MSDEQLRLWTARLHAAVHHWRDCTRSAEDAIGLLLERDEQLTAERDDLTRQLADMTTRRDMMQARALRNANNMHEFGRQATEASARLVVAEADLARERARSEAAESARDDLLDERTVVAKALGDALALMHHYDHYYDHYGDPRVCPEQTCRIGWQFHNSLVSATATPAAATPPPGDE